MFFSLTEQFFKQETFRRKLSCFSPKDHVFTHRTNTMSMLISNCTYNLCVEAEISSFKSKSLWWAFLLSERNNQHQRATLNHLHFVSKGQTVLEYCVLPAGICNRVSKCFFCSCIDCGKPHLVLNVVSLPAAEAAPWGWQPAQMRDCIAGLTAACPGKKWFVLHAEKWERTFAGGGTAPWAHCTLVLMSVLTKCFNWFYFNFFLLISTCFILISIDCITPLHVFLNNYSDRLKTVELSD